MRIVKRPAEESKVFSKGDTVYVSMTLEETNEFKRCVKIHAPPAHIIPFKILETRTNRSTMETTYRAVPFKENNPLEVNEEFEVDLGPDDKIFGKITDFEEKEEKIESEDFQNYLSDALRNVFSYIGNLENIMGEKK